jgi:hypothetical protein
MSVARLTLRQSEIQLIFLRLPRAAALRVTIGPLPASVSAEVSMDRLEMPWLSGAHHVEVSGWDAEEKFFVERSKLDGSQATGNRVSLEHKVEDGTMIFVRALESTAPQWSRLTPYEAEFAGRDGEGRYQFRLNAVRARQNGRKAVIH